MKQYIFSSLHFEQKHKEYELGEKKIGRRKRQYVNSANAAALVTIISIICQLAEMQLIGFIRATFDLVQLILITPLIYLTVKTDTQKALAAISTSVAVLAVLDFHFGIMTINNAFTQSKHPTSIQLLERRVLTLFSLPRFIRALLYGINVWQGFRLKYLINKQTNLVAFLFDSVAELETLGKAVEDDRSLAQAYDEEVKNAELRLLTNPSRPFLQTHAMPLKERLVRQELHIREMLRQGLEEQTPPVDIRRPRLRAAEEQYSKRQRAKITQQQSEAYPIESSIYLRRT